jgi:Zn-finger nucleic acid-binding protein
MLQQLPIIEVEIGFCPTCSGNVFLEEIELISFILLIYISKMHHAIWSGIGTFSF